MRVSLAEVQGYAKTLASLSDLASERASSAIALWMTMHPDATVAECRDFAKFAVCDAIAKYGDAAAVNAAKLYDETMGREGVDVPQATIYDGADEAAIEGTVRRLAGRLVGDDPDREDFARQAGRLAADRTRRAATDTVIRNVERDSKSRKGKGVRFARVPQRADPCGWCVMLASRGFDYLSKDSAAAGNHDNCTCLVMPGIDGRTTVEGYDSKGMYDRYSACRKTVEHMIEGERKRLQAADAYDADAFNEWCKNRIVKEMNTRDHAWLKTGVPVPIDYTEKTREQYGSLIDPSLPIDQRYQFKNIAGEDNERKDIFIHDVLSKNGFHVRGRLTINQGGDENIDIDLNGMLCEAKSPEAIPNDNAKDRYKFIYRDVQRARHQFEDRVTKNGKAPARMRIVLSNYYTAFGEEEEDAIFKRFCHEVRRQGFEEGLFITKSGTVLRAK